MSPAGLTSGAFGCGLLLLVAVDDEEEEEPQPAAVITRAVPARAASARVDMGATLGGTGHGPARTRSTPGQNRATGRAGGLAPVSVGGVPSPGILVVEDDDAIASGLVRVLEAQGFPVRRLARGGPATSAADAGI